MGYSPYFTFFLCYTMDIRLVLAGCLVIGLFPQLSPEDATRKQGLFAMLGCYNFMSSWIFVAGLFSLLTHLGMITVRRCLLSGKKHWRFILNHAGLWLALFAGLWEVPVNKHCVFLFS